MTQRAGTGRKLASWAVVMPCLWLVCGAHQWTFCGPSTRLASTRGCCARAAAKEIQALQSKANLKLIQAQVAAGHKMKDLGKSLFSTKFKATALEGSAEVTFDGMQNLRAVDIKEPEDALSKAGSANALAEELLKALQDGHDQSTRGSEEQDLLSFGLAMALMGFGTLLTAGLTEVSFLPAKAILSLERKAETEKVREQLAILLRSDCCSNLDICNFLIEEESFNSLIIAAAPNGGRHLTEEDMDRGLSKEQVLDLYTSAQRQRQLGFVLDIKKDRFV
eukprot:g23330.t1